MLQSSSCHIDRYLHGIRYKVTHTDHINQQAMSSNCCLGLHDHSSNPVLDKVPREFMCLGKHFILGTSHCQHRLCDGFFVQGWNLILSTFFDEAPWYVISAHDVQFAPGSLATLARRFRDDIQKGIDFAHIGWANKHDVHNYGRCDSNPSEYTQVSVMFGDIPLDLKIAILLCGNKCCVIVTSISTQHEFRQTMTCRQALTSQPSYLSHTCGIEVIDEIKRRALKGHTMTFGNII